MPRPARNPRPLPPRKPRLVFTENPRHGPQHGPRHGPEHRHGPQFRSAINPRAFLSDQTPRHRTSASSWVSPQFAVQNDTAVRRGGRKRNKKNPLPTNTMNTTSVLSLHQVKRTTACRFSSLLFKTSASVSQSNPGAAHKNTAQCAGQCPKAGDMECSQGSSVNQSEVPIETPRPTPSLTTREQRAATPAPAPTPCRSSQHVETPLGFTPENQGIVHSFHTPSVEGKDTSSAFTPPHMETPEIQHSVEDCSSTVLSTVFFSNQPQTPPHTLNASLLVKDTPERDYGLKVTWRRRRKLMTLLSDRGQLLASEAVISQTWF